MPANIYTPADAQAILQRIQSISDESVRQWGRMSAPEMLWHCRQQMEFVLSKQEIKVMKTIYRYQPLKWLIIFAMPWPKESPTAASIDAKKVNPQLGDTATEKDKLLQSLSLVMQAEQVQPNHPLFGSLSKHDWGCLIYKHLHHHLRQFSC
ncbi:MAG TPA: DUF1569 domain-containing protein [Phnomibacter sp.]|nr:DUF1569 domain-containing protein [Phnomibacter sp.]